jgi:hypothetical protein
MPVSGRDVPFYANVPDATHCFQASLKMVLKCFRPSEEYSWADLDVHTAKAEGLGTFPFAGLTWLHERGLPRRGSSRRSIARRAYRGSMIFAGSSPPVISRFATSTCGS